MIELGQTVRDMISGLVGVVAGRAEYLYGVPQVLLVPRERKDGAPCPGTWLEEGRVEVLTDEPRIGYQRPKR